MHKDFVLGLLKYNHWANLQTLASIKAISKPDEITISLYCHIIISERAWFERTRKKDPMFKTFWETLDLEKCEEHTMVFNKDWQEYIGESSDKELERICVYRNSRGELYNNTVREIIMHIINHSSYHRGQIASIVKKQKGTPAITDYIVFQRS